MGLLSWLFPSVEGRIAMARKELAAGRPAEARLELLDLDHPDAVALLTEAENALALKNLEAAIASANVGDDVRAAESLELADRFHRGGLDDAFRDARRTLREIRAERDAAERRRQEDDQRRLLSMDPIGLTGGPSWLDRTVTDDDFGEDRDELEARLALLVEGYPEALRGAVAELGPDFARAALDLDDGKPERAIQGLATLPDEQPLVWWERARAAYSLGDPSAAAKALRRFVSLAGGHHAVGQRHSATFLAQALAESGDLEGGLRTLRSARVESPKLGSMLFAHLLELTGALEEAERVLAGVIAESPKLAPAYAALARVRVLGGHRTAAMQALEAALQATHCPPGRCGFQPPDLEVHRMLATMYLEDGVERERALELAGIARGLVRQPTWADLYLETLTARALGRPDAPQLVDRLKELTPEGTPAAERVAAL